MQDKTVPETTALPLPAAEPQATPHRAEPGYMSCPRECGVDVREHNSSGLIDGRCDTGYWLAPAVDPVDAVVLRHLAWNLDQATDDRLAAQAAEYAALPPSPVGDGLRHLAECAQEQHRITGGAQ